MKTNRGKVYAVTFKDSKEENKSYLIKIYAVNEEHARQIFSASHEGCEIEEIEEDFDCVSEHYVAYEIPEIKLAQNVMYAILKEMSKDNTVTEDYIQDVLDMAYDMASMAIKKSIESANKKD